MEVGALGGDCGAEGRRWIGGRVSREGRRTEGCRWMGEAVSGDRRTEGRRWVGEREPSSREDDGLDGRRKEGEGAPGGDCGLDGRRRVGERVSRGDGEAIGVRVLILRLPPGRGIVEGVTTFGDSSSLCGGRGGWDTGLLLSDGAGLRTPFLEGARLGALLDGNVDVLALLLRRGLLTA